MAVIAISNQKGGVGKTTTAVNLGVALSELGKRVLLVDLDPQANLTVHLGIREPDTLPRTITDVLLAIVSPHAVQGPTVRDVILPMPHGVDLVPCNLQLAAAELTLFTSLSREMVLRDALRPVVDEYDFIIVDCLPSLGLLVINALAAADGVLVPVQADYLSMQGVSQLLQAVAVVRDRLNPRLKLLGLLFTMADFRTLHAREVVQATRAVFQDSVPIFDTVIRLSVAFKESSKAGQSVLAYAPDGRGAAAFRDLAREVVRQQLCHGDARRGLRLRDVIEAQEQWASRARPLPQETPSKSSDVPSPCFAEVGTST
ncbi:MAG TPA: AAA family ATPase [Chloroflexota bacterium]